MQIYLYCRYKCIIKILIHITRNVKKTIRKDLVDKMTLTQKRIIILLVIIVIAAVLGRLAVRAVMNFMLGGTMFGGNFL